METKNNLSLRDEQKVEALERMKILKLHPNPIREFKSGKLNMSESGGILYHLEEEEEKIVKIFEEKHGCVVYHLIKSFTGFGTLLALLYVGKEKEEWEQDKEDLKEGYAFCYVENLADKWCSEFGTIGVKPQFGGVARTC
jgi:hypothetical protein